MKALFLAWAFFVATTGFAKDKKICDSLYIDADILLNFTETETRLLCGDPGNPPWAEPPESQIRAFLIAFLQARGYFLPTFTRKDGVLHVDAGDRTKIEKVLGKNMPPEYDISPVWVPPLKPLTPDLLDEYAALVRSRIGAKGYPCSKVTPSANVADTSLTLTAEPGPRQRVVTITSEIDGNIEPGTLRRYYPFEEGEWFNGELVEIANNRIKAQEILSSVYIVSHCGEQGAEIAQRGVLGAPRRVSVGFGLNTENYVILRANYRNSRLDNRASQFNATINAHYFQQRVESAFYWYLFGASSSFHLKPLVAFERNNEPLAETRNTVGSVHLGAYHDFWGQRWQAYFGPNLNLLQTVRGTGPDFSRLVELEVNAQVQSHDWEYHQALPNTGHKIDIRAATASKRLASTLTMNRMEFRATKLFSLVKLDPPLLVLGLRTGGAATQAEPDVELPNDYMHFLGGNSNLRGFPRKSIPSKDYGARTAAFVGAELRLVTVIPYQLQPLVFIDYGATGTEFMRLDRPQYYSPGIGVLWNSPIGALRGAVSRGYIVNEPKEMDHPVPAGWVGIFSFGEDF